MASAPSVIGRYQVRERLGQGGMGALFLALDPAIDRLVALKLLRVDSEEMRARFLREARSAGRLQHPHIVTIYDVGEHDGQPFIAMEYIKGETLGELVQRRAMIGDPELRAFGGQLLRVEVAEHHVFHLRMGLEQGDEMLGECADSADADSNRR